MGQGGNTITNTLSSDDIAMDQTDPNNANDGATASTTISNEADISTTKTASATTANEGDNITYALSATNNGIAQATNLTVTDSCPAGTTFVSATPSGTTTYSANTWAVGTLANTTSETLDLVCSVDVGQGGNTITNTLSTADIAMDQTDPNNANDGATASTTISNEADISTTKTASATTANEGDNITYSIGVTNNGIAQATSVVITDSCPVGTTFISVTPSGTSTYAAGSWTVGTLNNTASETLSLICSVNVGQGGNTIINTLSTSDISMNQTDSNNANDGATASTTISNETDISTTKTASPTSGDEGDDITYSIDVTNNGTAQATSIVVTDACPSGTTFVSATPSGTTNYTSGTWTVGTLNNSATENLSLVCNINSGTSGTTITNTLSSSDIAMDQTDPDNTNDGSTASTGINNDADISMTKTASTTTASEGDNITYSLGITNNGPAQATTLSVSDACPAGTTFVSSTPSGASTYVSGTWTIGALASTSSETLDLVCSIDVGQGGNTVTNTISSSDIAMDQTDPDNTNDSAAASTSISNEADISTTKTASATTVNEGDNITYSLGVTNNGAAQTTNLTVIDSCPTGTTFVSATPSGASTFASGTWIIGTLANAGSESLDLVCSVDVGQGGNTITNTLSSSDIAMDQTDPNNTNDGSTASTTISNEADISTTKTASTTTANEGDNITYSIGVTNNGVAQASSLAVSDSCPAGTTFVSASPSGVTSYTSGTWTVGTLNNAASETLNLVCSVDVGQGGNTVTNTLSTADIAMDQTDPNNVNDGATASTTISNESDISTTKTASPATVDEGDNITYSIGVTNNGAAQATNLTVADACPTGTTFVNATPSGTSTFAAGTWTVGTLANSASETLSLVCTVNAGTSGTTINNTLSSSDIAMDQTDPNNANDGATASTTINNDADISMTKTASAATANEGDNITYSIDVTNNGPAQATTLEISDSCPTGTTFVNVTTSGTSTYASGTWTVGTLANSASETLDLVCSVDVGQGGNTVTNTLSSSDIAMDQTDPDNTNDGASASTTISDEADISLTKTASATTANEGDNITYSIDVMNNGTAQATNLTITDSCPSGTTLVSTTPSGTTTYAAGTWTVGTLANTSNETLDLVCSVDVGQGGNTITNTLSSSDIAMDQTDPNNTNDGATASTTISDEADISTTKTVSATSANEGDNITYSLSVTNNGTAQATNLAVTDSCPAGTTFVSAAPSGATTYTTGTWSIGTLANTSNETLDLICSVDVGQGGNTITNTLSSSDITMDQTDPNNANDGATASTTISDEADISMTKVASSTTANEGDNITYSLGVTNNGVAQASSLTITDSCPTGTTFVSSAPSGSTTYTTGAWTIGLLNNTATETLDLICSVDVGQGGNTVTNTLSSADIAMDQTDPNNANDSATASTTISNEADISTTKTASPTSADEGDDITYSIGITNNGAAQATSVVVTDVCPSGTTFVSATPSGTTNYTSSTWTVGTLNSSATENLSLVCNINSGTSGTTITNTLSSADIAMDQTDPDNTNDGSTASTGINNDADISMTKTASATTTNEGDNITFAISINNNGPAQATNLSITDSCPVGTTFVSATPSGSTTFSSGTWIVDTLANAANETLDLLCSVDIGQGGNTITNTLSTSDVTMDQTDPNNANDGATASTTISNDADISTTKTVSATSANESDSITYSLGVTNNGAAQATNLTITDSCPAGTTFVSSTPSGTSTYSSGTWTVGTLANSANETLDLVCSVDIGQGGNTITNTLSSSDIAMDQTDPNNTNDGSTASTTISNEADISTTKTASATTANEGDNITYSLGVTNNGVAQASSLAITDSCPTGTTFVSATPSGASTYVSGTWTIGTLNNAAIETLDLVCSVDVGQGGNTITNTLSSSDIAMDQTDPNNANDSAIASTTISNDADISTTKTVSTSSANEGDNITYSIGVTNSGTAQATSLEITDSCPAGTTFVSVTPSGSTAYSAGTWTIGTLNNTASETLDLVCNVDIGQSANTITNTLSSTDIAMDQTDPNNTNDGSSANTTINNDADIALTMTTSPLSADEGDDITYTVTATNNGPAQTSALEITDACPTNTTFVSATPTAPSSFSGGVWNIGTLNNSSSISYTLVCNVNAGTSGSTITHDIVTADISLDQTDSNNSNDGVTGSTSINNDTDIELTMTSSPANIDEGSDVTFILTALNNGPATSNNLNITNTCPLGTTVSSITGSGSTTYASGIWSIGSLTTSSSETLTIVCTANVGQAGNTITNSVNTPNISMDQTDIVPFNDNASASVNINNEADIATTLSINDDTPDEGQNVTYTYTTTNNGPAQATTTAVTSVTCPTGTTFVSTTPSGSTTYASGTWTIGTLANAANETLQLVCSIDAGTANTTISNSITNTDVTQNQDDSITANEDVSQDITVNNETDIEMVLNVDDDTPDEGQNVTYTYTATNNGPAQATTTAVDSVTCPTGTTFVSTTPSGSTTYASGTWTIGTLANAANETLQLVCSVDAGTANTTIANSVVNTDVTQTQDDSITANEDVSQDITINNEADIEMALSVDDNTPDEGQNITYTYIATNNGPAQATTTAVASVVCPIGTTFVSTAPSGSTTYTSGTWTIGTLANTANENLQLVCNIDAGTANTTILNSVVNTDVTQTQDDSITVNEDISQNITINNEADIEMALIVDDDTPNESQNVTYTYTATNNGPAQTTTTAVASVNCPAGTTFVSTTPSGSTTYASGTWTIGTLANAANETLQLVCSVDVGTANTTIANSVINTDVTQTQDDSITANEDVSQDITINNEADIEMALSVDNDTPDEGQNVTYTYTATNNGPAQATTTAVASVVCPTGTTFVSTTPSGSTIYTSGTWTIVTLANTANETLQLVCSVDVGTANTTIANTVVNTDVTQIQNDSITANEDVLQDITVNNEADIEVTLSVDDDTPDEGQNVTYTYTATNNGPAQATTTVVAAANCPVGTTFVSTTPSGSTTYTSGTWTIGSLANATNETLQLVCSVDAGTANTTISNSVVNTDVTQTQNDSITTNEDVSQGITVNNEADIEIAISVDDDTPDEGQNVTYTYTATNNGPAQATTTAVASANCPAGTTFVSTTPSGSTTNTSGTWTIGTLNSSVNETLQLVCSVDAGTANTTISNSVINTDVTQIQDDSTTTNENVSQDITVNNEADIEMTLSVDDDTPDEGQNVTYTYTATNNGPAQATATAVASVICPTGTTFVSTTSSGSTIYVSGTWTIGSLANAINETLQLVCSVDVGTANTTIPNTVANTDVTQTQNDSITANENVSQDIAVNNEADIKMTLSVDDDTPDEGQSVTYTYTATNNGPAQATTTVVAAANCPVGTTFVSTTPSGSTTYASGTWTIGSLVNATNETLQLVCSVDTGTANTTISNSVVNTDVTQTQNDSLTANEDVSQDITVNNEADIEIAISVDDDTPDEGQNVIYTYTATNNGPAQATTTAVASVVCSTGTTFVSITPSGSTTYASGTWTIGTLANAANETLQLVCSIDAGTANTTISNSITNTDVTQNQDDSITANEDVSQDITINNEADIEITLSVDNDTPDEGQSVTYTYTAANNGPAQATTTAVASANCPVGTTFVGTTPSGSTTYASGTWTIGNLANAANETLQLVCSVDAGTANTTISNSVVNTDVTQTQDDSITANEDVSQDIKVNKEADIEMALSVDDDTPDEGQNVTYTYTATNNGPAQATTTAVASVTCPIGTTFVSTTPSGSTTYTSGTWTIGTLNSSANETLQLVCSIDVGTTNTTISNSVVNTDVTQTQDDSITANENVSQDITVNNEVDIEMALNVDNDAPDEGQNVTYTYTATNNGPAQATTTAVASAVCPTGTTFVSTAPSGSTTYASGTWTIGSLANATNETLQLVCSVDTGTANTTISNSVINTDVTQTQNDSMTANEDVFQDITVNNEVDIEIALSVDNDTPDESQIVTYTYTAINNGPAQATTTAVASVNCPTGTIFVSTAPSGSTTYTSGTWTIGNLANSTNETLQLVCSINVGTANTTISNSVVNTDVTQTQNDSITSNEDISQNITVNNEADIEMALSVDDNTPDEGQNVTYTYTATNNGPAQATTTAVAFAVCPTGTTFVSTTPSGSTTYTSGTWTIGTLANASNETLQLVCSVDAGTANTIIPNTVVNTDVTQTQDDSITANEDVSQDIAVNNEVDIEIAISVGDDTPDEGQNATYTYTAINNGPAQATATAVASVNCPVGTTFISTIPSGSTTYASGTWTIGTLNSSANETLQLVCNVDAGTANTTISNSVVNTDVTQTQDDLIIANENVSQDITVNNQVDIEMAISVDNDTPDEGQNVTYTYTATNNGPAQATITAVASAVCPTGTTFVSTTPSGSTTYASGTWTIGTLNSSANETLQLVCSVDAGTANTTISNLITNTDVTQNQDDSITANEDVSQDIAVNNEVDIEMAISVNNDTPDEGQNVTYTYTTTNNGPAQATTTAVASAACPTGTTFVSTTLSGSTTYASGTWTIGTLNSSANETLQLVCSVDAGTANTTISNSVVNTDVTQTQDDLITSNEDVSQDITVNNEADIAMALSVDDDTPDEGQNVTYTYTATNNGPAQATTTAVASVNCPAGTILVSTIPSGSTTYTSSTWTIGNLANAAIETLQLVCSVDAGTANTTISNSITNTNVTQTQDDSITANENVSQDITVNNETDIKMTLSVDDNTPDEGQNVTYTYTATNNGPAQATTTAVASANCPAGTTFVSTTPSGSTTYTSGTWTVGTLANATNETLQLVCSIDAGTANTTIANTVLNTDVTQTQDDSITANEDVSQDITVNNEADIEMALSVDDDTPDEGQNITYTYTATNNGPAQATTTAVASINCPTDTTFISTTPSGSTTFTSGTWTIGNLANTINETLQLVCSVDAGTANTTIPNTIVNNNVTQTQDDSITANEDVSQDITVNNEVDIEMALSVDDDTPDEGQNVTYTYTATNNGPAQATTTAVASVACPTGTTFVGTTPSGSTTYISGTWTIGTLANAANETLQLVCNVNIGAANTTIANTVVNTDVTQTQNDSLTANEDVSQDIAVNNEVDIEMALSVDDETPDEGQNITYTYTSTNNGPAQATITAVASVACPTGTTFVSTTPSGSTTYTSGTWTIGNLANATNETLQLVCSVDAGTANTTIANTVVNTDVTQTQNDSLTANEDVSQDITVNNEADIEMTLSVDDDTPDEGQNVTYTYTATNNGPARATTTTVASLTCPTDTTFVSTTPSGSTTYTSGTWTIGNLVNTANETLQLVCNVDAGTANTTIANTVVNTDVTQTQNDSLTANEDVSQNITVNNEANIEMALSVDDNTPDEGQNITYTYTTTNNGPARATATTVASVTCPTGTTFVSTTPSGSTTYASGTWTIGTLTNTSNETLQLVCSVDIGTANTTISNSIVNTDVTQTQDDSLTANEDVSQNITVNNEADIEIALSVDNNTPDEGQDITYTYTATNNGPAQATTTAISTVNCPTGTTFVSTSPSGATTYASGTWTIGTLANSTNATLQLVCNLDAGTGASTITLNINNANVTQTQNDSLTANEDRSQNITVNNETDISTTKTSSPAVVPEGGDITYIVTATNNGPAQAKNLTIDDVCPAGTSPITITPSIGTYAVGTWNIGTLNTASPGTLTLVCNANAGEQGTSKTNTITSTSISLTQSDSDSSNDDSSATTHVNNSQPVVTDDIGKTDEDNAASFNILVNDSDADAGDVLTISDIAGLGTSGALPSGATVAVVGGQLEYDPNGQFETLAVGASTTDTFTYTATDGAYTVNGSVTITINGVNDAPTAIGTIATQVFPEGIAEVISNPSDPTVPMNFTGLNNGITIEGIIDFIVNNFTVVSSKKTDGADSQFGIVDNLSTAMPGVVRFDDALIMSSGTAASIEQPNSADNTSEDIPNGGTDPLPTEPIADIPLGGNLFDRASLEFEFIASKNYVVGQFVFGSDEYNEFANGNFADRVGIMVHQDLNGDNNIDFAGDGPEINVALTPDNQLITINSVNLTQNPQIYNDNDPGDNSPVPFKTEMDGFSDQFQFFIPIIPGILTKIRIAVGDFGDGAFNSWWILKADSFYEVDDFKINLAALFDDIDSDDDASSLTYSVQAVGGGAIPFWLSVDNDPDGDSDNSDAVLEGIPPVDGVVWDSTLEVIATDQHGAQTTISFDLDSVP